MNHSQKFSKGFRIIRSYLQALAHNSLPSLLFQLPGVFCVPHNLKIFQHSMSYASICPIGVRVCGSVKIECSLYEHIRSLAVVPLQAATQKTERSELPFPGAVAPRRLPGPCRPSGTGGRRRSRRLPVFLQLITCRHVSRRWVRNNKQLPGAGPCSWTSATSSSPR